MELPKSNQINRLKSIIITSSVIALSFGLVGGCVDSPDKTPQSSGKLETKATVKSLEEKHSVGSDGKVSPHLPTPDTEAAGTNIDQVNKLRQAAYEIDKAKAGNSAPKAR